MNKLAIPLLSALALVAGCTRGGDDSASADDTALGDDSGGDDTGEDTGPPPCDDIPIGGTLSADALASVPVLDITVALIPVTFEANGTLELQDTSYSTTVTGLTAGNTASWSFCVGEEALDEDYFAIDPIEAPNTEVVLYLIGAFADVNGDGEAGLGDVLVAAHHDLLASVRGETYADLTDIGGDLGWNMFDLDFEDTGSEEMIPLPMGIEDLAVDANLLPIIPDDLSGVIESDLDRTVQVDLYAISDIFFSGTAPVDPSLSSVFVDANDPGATFNMGSVFNVRPPQDHFITDSPETAALGLQFAAYAGIAYGDTDGDQQWDVLTETPLATSVQDVRTDSRMVFYTEADSLLAGLFLGTWGIKVGWSLVHIEEGSDGPPPPVDWNEGLVLAADPP